MGSRGRSQPPPPMSVMVTVVIGLTGKTTKKCSFRKLDETIGEKKRCKIVDNNGGIIPPSIILSAPAPQVPKIESA